VTPRVERLTAALTGEYAAIYAYGVLGVRLNSTNAAKARKIEQAHRDRRDLLLLRLTAADIAVPPAAAGYQLPFAVTNSATAVRLAAEVELRLAAQWHAAIAVTTTVERALALDGLIDCTTWGTQWRLLAGITPATTAFPGRS